MEWRRTLGAAAVLGAAALSAGGAEAAIGKSCRPNADNEFVFKMDFNAGQWGAYTVEGCDGTFPTLLIDAGKEYTFVQKDASNWMHPLGYAYYPDGAHGFGDFAEVPELEHPTPDDCATDDFKCNTLSAACEAPLYGINGEYETCDDWNNGVTSGLDVYEPAFFLPQEQWAERGGDKGFGVKLMIPKDSKTGQFYYFCHVHAGMSGKVMVNEESKNDGISPNVPKFGLDLVPTYYGETSEFDEECGTFGVGEFHDKKDEMCPGQNFLCDHTDTTFSKCMEAINCKMNHQMRVSEHPDNQLAVFMQQMIAHHENAVSMSRIALKHATASKGYDDEDAEVEALLRDIMATQNHQIQVMQGWLDKHGFPTKVCDPHAKKDDHDGHDHDDEKDDHDGHDHDDEKDDHDGHDHGDEKDDHDSSAPAAAVLTAAAFAAARP
jgi:hypothetical protein